ncbi:MAG TPA: response regulator [Deltaproteobacteria bacterium]|nr:response regulator [Deltaproteobacteria bacterium]
MNEKKMLVVDDETFLLDMLEELFTDAGYCVFTAQNAEDALTILKKDSIMVMFLDLKLPGMSGIELCRQIRKENQIGIIHALTGYANFYGLLECRAAGFDDFFLKPVDVSVLLKAAHESFERLLRWDVYKYDLT